MEFPEVKNSLGGIKRRFDKAEENISLGYGNRSYPK